MNDDNDLTIFCRSESVGIINEFFKNLNKRIKFCFNTFKMTTYFTNEKNKIIKRKKFFKENKLETSHLCKEVQRQ